MNVLLYSPVFWPSLGGIEIVSDVLAQNLVKLGHACTVVTETPLGDALELERTYAIVRRPNWRERLALARGSSIVHSNAASVAMVPYAWWAGVPFVWTHNGYQASCVDGLGWAYGRPAPLTPLASLRFHAREKGWGWALREAIKLGARRFVARHVDLNLAGSRWVARRQPLPNQHVAYNPYPLARFLAVRDVPAAPQARHDFLFVGRLVGEKGVDVLIEAFSMLLKNPAFAAARLGIAGSGELRAALAAQAQRLGAAGQIEFLGALHGEAVPAAMAQARFGVVPSTWEEPYGGVSLEWLAAGRGLIVSSRGGHAECVADAGLHFENGNARALAQCMEQLLADPELAQRQRQRARERVAEFDEERLTRHFVAMYALALERRKRAPAARSRPEAVR
jgi:glycosyltransferase involved in cell wall biosynthesis